MKTAGAYLATVTFTGVEAPWPGSDRTTSGYRPAASVGGTWALICSVEVAKGAAACCSGHAGSPRRLATARRRRWLRRRLRPDRNQPAALPLPEIRGIHHPLPDRGAAAPGRAQRNHAEPGCREHDRPFRRVIPSPWSPATLASVRWTSRQRPFQGVRGSPYAHGIHIHDFHQPRIGGAAPAALAGGENNLEKSADRRRHGRYRPIPAPPGVGKPPPPTGPVAVDPYGISADSISGRLPEKLPVGPAATGSE